MALLPGGGCMRAAEIASVPRETPVTLRASCHWTAVAGPGPTV
ncbi:MAG TPA: hypothetical protein VMT11_09755 [Myxococcaceae bacterium]|nr:hypothetical protein [Myxococcaceae bacterium]